MGGVRFEIRTSMTARLLERCMEKGIPIERAEDADAHGFAAWVSDGDEARMRVFLDELHVPYRVRGAKGGVGVMDEGLIDVLTPDGVLTVSQAREKYGNAQFDVFRGTMKKGLLPKLMPLLPFLQHRPKVDLKKCIGCGVCQEACPVPEKAVHSGHGKKAKYDYKKCIRCYCCQEMCPAKAISVYRSPLNKLLGGK